MTMLGARRTFLLIGSLLLASPLVAACDDESPIEEAGEEVEEAGDEVEDAAEEVADEIEESTD